MGNQVIASSAIFKKPDLLRIQLGLMSFSFKSMKPLQAIVFGCKQTKIIQIEDEPAECGMDKHQ